MVTQLDIPTGQRMARERWETQASGAAFDRKKADHLTSDAQAFIVLQSFCAIASVNAQGELDGVLACGGPGMVRIGGEKHCYLPLSALPPNSRLAHSLHQRDGSLRWALFFISHPTRERLCVHGTAQLVSGSELPVPSGPQTPLTLPDGGSSEGAEWIKVAVDRSFFHCVKYIAPSVSGLTCPAIGWEPQGWRVEDLPVRTISSLSSPVRAFLQQQTLSFLCTVDGEGQPAINHRGGSPGYLITREPDAIAPGGRLFQPDYPGNGAFEAIGNILDSPQALLIVPSYPTHVALTVGGHAEVLEMGQAPPEIAGAYAGAQRVVAIQVQRVGAHRGEWSTTVSYETARAMEKREKSVSTLSPAAPDALPSGNARAPRVAERLLHLHDTSAAGRVEVQFVPGPTLMAKPGETVLELAEANGVPLESGCRMGICGVDPIRVIIGSENLAPMRTPEQATLERLGLPADCRMACMARVHGAASVAPITDVLSMAEAGERTPTTTFTVDPSVRRIVVIGTGVAGITAVEEVRKLHPDGEIVLLGAEPYDFYNRMAISKLISESTSIDKLYLMTRDWAERRRVRYLSGVAATTIDRLRSVVVTEDDEEIPYDRLVLATGARSRIPPLEGYGMAGTHILRTIDDAVQIQQHVRRRRCRSAVVVGGGLLGLEAAHHLTQVGVRVTVLDHGPWPLKRQLDITAGTLLQQIMSDLGMEFVPSAEVRRFVGSDAVEAVELTNGRTIAAKLCLVAAGIVPEIDLAHAAGLATARGVVVNERMQTSDGAIYAVGDVAEYAGDIHGLWPASVEQARTAAANLLGGDVRYRVSMPPSQLKVPGIDILSAGEIAARGDDTFEIAQADLGARRYRKLVIRHDKICGAILIGYSELFDDVADAVAREAAVADLVGALRRGDWSVLGSAATPLPPHHSVEPSGVA